MAAGAAIGGVPIAQSYRTGVARQSLQRELCRRPAIVGGGRIADQLLELGPAFGVAGHDSAALLVAGDLGFLRHHRSSRKSTCRRSSGSYLRSTMRSGSLRRFLRVT